MTFLGKCYKFQWVFKDFSLLFISYDIFMFEIFILTFQHACSIMLFFIVKIFTCVTPWYYYVLERYGFIFYTNIMPYGLTDMIEWNIEKLDFKWIWIYPYIPTF